MRGRHALAAVLAAAAAMTAACGSSSTDQAAPAPPPPADVSAPPAGLTWANYQGVQVPRGDAGPHRYSPDGVRVEFDHTPQGVALAAMTHSVRVGIAPDTSWPNVLTASVAPGPGRDEFAVNRVLVSITQPVAKGDAPVIVGYEITDYTAGNAVVWVYTREADDSLAATRVQEVWREADWRMVMPAPGESTAPTVKAVDTLPASVVRVSPDA
ncbi:hypothetical protein [Tomitella gaofuii]|uniref:hypothetical protein n=1 Tax=Tomitella gaofuii TaxID=2760083 RepID=UPI0015FE1D60|nr:hypothetical protein [Tomitella gaofuii]